MTSRSYFGKMNSTLGSVVPLAMFVCCPYLAKQDLWLLVLSPAWSLPPIISRPPLEPISLLLVAGIHKAHRSEDQRIRVTESMVFKVHVAWNSKVWLYHSGREYMLARAQIMHCDDQDLHKGLSCLIDT